MKQVSFTLGLFLFILCSQAECFGQAMSTMCAGTNLTLTDPTPGGAWSSSNTSVATIGTSTGLVTAANAGTVTLSYAVTTACGSATATR